MSQAKLPDFDKIKADLDALTPEQKAEVKASIKKFLELVKTREAAIPMGDRGSFKYPKAFLEGIKAAERDMGGTGDDTSAGS